MTLVKPALLDVTYTILGPGLANTHRPAQILRGRPGPVLSPVPGLVEALTRTSLSTTASQKNTGPASVARSALLCYYMLHIYTNISIVPRIEKSFIIGCQEMDALGQEISKEEVRQTTIPAKTWKINRLLNSSFYFLSSWQCGSTHDVVIEVWVCSETLTILTSFLFC